MDHPKGFADLENRVWDITRGTQKETERWKRKKKKELEDMENRISSFNFLYDSLKVRKLINEGENVF